MTIPHCLDLPPIPDPIEIPMFGYSIGGIDLIDQLQPMLAPLMPFFDIIDAIMAVFNCVKAIPDSLGPPPDPTVIAKCIPQLGEKISKLLALNPILVLPKMMKQICNVIIRTIQTARNQIAFMVDQLTSILAAVDRAATLKDRGLTAIISCARANVATAAANVAKGLGAIGKLIGLVNLLLGMVGFPAVPSLSGLAGIPLAMVLAPLDALIAVFKTVRDIIPIP